MSKLGTYVLAFVSLSLALVAPLVQAHIAVFDEYWTQRQSEALRRTLEAYEPNPHNVTNHFNYHAALAETTEIANGTRRDLHQVRRGIRKPRGGRYQSLNAIDKCWRGNKRWDKNRKKLADCVLGFGRKTTGGKNGPIYVVTDPSDKDLLNPKPGTLRHAVTRDRPLWIIFARSMNIKLQQELMITNDKTIDGRGASVHISGGAGLTLQFVKNVIIHNIHIKRIKQGNGGLIRDCESHFGLRTKSDGDGINIFGATNIWIDHVSMTKCSDGMIDAIMGSTAITVSNCHFTYTKWKSWNWQSEKDYFLNGAYFVQSGKANAMSATPKNPIPANIKIRPQPGTKVRRLTKDAGTLGCMPGKSC